MSKHQGLARLAVVGLALALLSGCSMGKYAKEQSDDNTVLLVGSFDASEGPFKLQRGSIQQVRPANRSKPYRDVRIVKADNIFYRENLPTGLYKLHSVGGREKALLLWSNNFWTWGFPKDQDDPAAKFNQVRAEKPGIYYVGSYKIRVVREGGFLTPTTYATDLMDSPSEKEVLESLLKYTEGTKWHAMVQQRLAELK